MQAGEPRFAQGAGDRAVRVRDNRRAPDGAVELARELVTQHAIPDQRPGQPLGVISDAAADALDEATAAVTRDDRNDRAALCLVS